jgi:uncharacterized delta-60 repeat protein
MKHLMPFFLLFQINVAFGQPGTLDNTFGTGGIVTTDFGNDYAYGYATAIQNDGKIIVAGEDKYHFTLSRYNSNGSLDNTFDSDGKVFTVIGNASHARAVCIQNDGKILAGGYSHDGTYWYFTLVRYTSNGIPDPGFDNDGIVTTLIGTRADNRIMAIKVQSDGKILAAGKSDGDFALVRYNSNGALDSTFSSDGTTTADLQGYDDDCTSMALQPDGKIVLGGSSFTGINTAPSQCVVMRYNSNGTPDSSFSNDGNVILSIGSLSSYFTSIGIQPDGKIVAAGLSYNYQTNWDFTLVRFNSNGTIDNTFDADGKVLTNVGTDGFSNSLAIQKDGKILVCGNTSNDPSSEFALVRYNTNGSLDNTFASNGIVTTSIGTNDDHAFSIAIQADNKIIVAGFTYSSGSYDFALVRYNGDNNTTSLKESTGTAAISVFPNPSEGMFNISCGTAGEKKIFIYDLSGNCVFWNTSGKHEEEIDLTGQLKAIYFIEIISEGQRLRKKLILH